MKLLKVLIVVFFFTSCNQGQSHKAQAQDQLGLDSAAGIYSVESEDTAMNTAIDKARKTINEFDKALKSNNPAYTDFAVKKRYQTPDGGGEHMWIGEIIPVNGSYKGIVNNDAESTTEVKYGDTVIIAGTEITDWMYLENNKLRGGYTIRAIRNKMTKEEQSKMDKDLSFKIED